MEIFIILSSLIAFIISITTLLLITKLISTISENSRLKNYIKHAENIVNQARYGNFQIKLEEKDKIGLYKSLNNLFESITDRDLVINEYREKEKENYNLKEEFIAALTHDLKVPIIAQDKTFDLLLQNKFNELTTKQKEVILKLKESNTDLKEMVDLISEAYKIENNGIDLKIDKNIDVNSFLKNCIEKVESLGKSTGKEILFYSKENDLLADFDDFLIKRVINNLIINAIKHSKTTDKIEIFLNKENEFFSIEVADYGEGMNEEEVEKIFNKYYSNSKRLTTGLGLYLANKIIKKHNGKIEVNSKKGEGSVFKIILPIKNPVR